MSQNIYKKAKKIGIIVTVIALILGILSSSFGVCVLALGKTATEDKNDGVSTNSNNTVDPEQTDFYSPTEEFKNLSNEMDLKDEIVVIDDSESKKINDSIVSIETFQNYYGEEFYSIKLDKAREEFESLNNVYYGGILYLQGDANSAFGGDQILKIRGIYSHSGETQIEASVPYLEEVFDNVEINALDALDEENFVKAYYADGVSSHFGDIDKEILDLADDKSDVEVQNLSAAPNSAPEATNLATQYSTDGADLIVTIEYDLGDDGEEDEDEDKEDDDPLDTSFSINGSFGIRDLAAHLVCDMPKAAQFNELYFGLSGQTFLDVTINGSVSADGSVDATEKDLGILKLEGLNDKRFPIAVFEFQGTTPIYITNSVYEAKKEMIHPQLFIILYANWEGEITLGLDTKIGYAHSFNNGLRVFKNGEPCLSFESYPYTKAYDIEEDGFTFETKLSVKAESDLTLFGGSVLFFIAGVNVGEFSAIRVGVEAEGEITVTIDNTGKTDFTGPQLDSFYIRGYIKLIEVKLKIKVDGKSFLKNISVDRNFEFTLLDLTLFVKGKQPDKYKPKIPVSSMKIPEEFDAAMSIVFDVSGSMSSTVTSGQSKLDVAKDASKNLISMVSQFAGEEIIYGIGIVKFSDSAETVALPHIDYAFLSDCVDTLDSGGGTSIYTGIDNALTQLENTKATSKIIILMTDGQDFSDTQTLASAQVAADKGIKIYTIGFGNDVNEDILKQIAEKTNGEYRFASTENIISIVGSFMYAQQASAAEVLAEQEGTVGEGQTTTPYHFSVEDTNGKLMSFTSWPGSFLKTIITDPNGRIVDENYPGAVIDESTIPSSIIIDNPIVGDWEVKIKGIETSYEQEPYYSIVSFKEATSKTVNEEMTTMEAIAAYCLPIGIFVTLVSVLALIFLCKKQKTEITNN